MKFKYFNLYVIRQDYLMQIEQFVIDYMFLFDFNPMDSDFTGLIINNEIVVLISFEGAYTGSRLYPWEQIPIECLEQIIEQILEPGLLQYQIREQGNFN